MHNNITLNFFIVFILYTLGVTCQNEGAPLGIVGGHTVKIEDAPYMVSVRLNGTYHWCGGSIIDQWHVLTAAHCIVSNRQYKILAGATDIDVGTGDIYDVERIVVHEKYSNLTADYDVAVLKLATPLIMSEKVAPVKLASKALNIKPGKIAEVTGWGQISEEGPMSEDLRQVSVSVISNKSCQLEYIKAMRRITNRMLCAGDNGKDACQGDSGGPLTYNEHQIGIASFGAGCGIEPGVYTKVSSVRPWIQKVIASN